MMTASGQIICDTSVHDDVELFGIIKEMLTNRESFTIEETRFLIRMYYRNRYTETQADKIEQLHKKFKFKKFFNG